MTLYYFLVHSPSLLDLISRVDTPYLNGSGYLGGISLMNFPHDTKQKTLSFLWDRASVKCQLTWNLLCRLDWPQTHRVPADSVSRMTGTRNCEVFSFRFNNRRTAHGFKQTSHKLPSNMLSHVLTINHQLGIRQSTKNIKSCSLSKRWDNNVDYNPTQSSWTTTTGKERKDNTIQITDEQTKLLVHLFYSYP